MPDLTPSLRQPLPPPCGCSLPPSPCAGSSAQGALIQNPLARSWETWSARASFRGHRYLFTGPNPAQSTAATAMIWWTSRGPITGKCGLGHSQSSAGGEKKPRLVAPNPSVRRAPGRSWANLA